RLEPWLAIRVVQRDAGAHLRDVRRRMQPVAFHEVHAARTRQRGADMALAAAGDAHHDDRRPCRHQVRLQDAAPEERIDPLRLSTDHGPRAGATLSAAWAWFGKPANQASTVFDSSRRWSE